MIVLRKNTCSPVYSIVVNSNCGPWWRWWTIITVGIRNDFAWRCCLVTIMLSSDAQTDNAGGSYTPTRVNDDDWWWWRTTVWYIIPAGFPHDFGATTVWGFKFGNPQLSTENSGGHYRLLISTHRWSTCIYMWYFFFVICVLMRDPKSMSFCSNVRITCSTNNHHIRHAWSSKLWFSLVRARTIEWCVMLGLRIVLATGANRP